MFRAWIIAGAALCALNPAQPMPYMNRTKWIQIVVSPILQLSIREILPKTHHCLTDGFTAAIFASKSAHGILFKQETEECALQPSELGTELKLEYVNELDDESFRELFKVSLVKRTKLAGLKRNAEKITNER